MFLEPSGDMFMEHHPFVRNQILKHQPSGKILRRNHIYLCAFPCRGCTAIEVVTARRRIIVHHIHSDRVGDHIEFDIVMITVPAFRTLHIVNVSEIITLSGNGSVLYLGRNHAVPDTECRGYKMQSLPPSWAAEAAAGHRTSPRL